MARYVVALMLLTGGLAVGVGSEEPAPPAKGQGKEPLPKVTPSPVGLKLGLRNAAADVHSKGLAHNSAPLIEVLQPQPNVMVVTMTGLATVGGLPCEDSVDEIVFDLLQAFEVVAAPPIQRAKLTMDLQLAGLFRGNRAGAGVASICPAEATVLAGDVPVMQAAIPGRTHSGKDALLISQRAPVVEAIVVPGQQLALVQKFSIECSHPKKCFHKNVVTATFGPETGRTPDWMALLDPTRDIPKTREFGFRVFLRADTAP